MDSGVVLPRKREELGLSVTWGRVLSLMQQMQQSAGKLSQITQKGGLIFQ